MFFTRKNSPSPCKFSDRNIKEILSRSLTFFRVIRLFEPLKQEIANLEVFQNQFQMINGNANAVLNGVVQLKNKRTRQKKLNDLKLAFSELYLLLVLLQNYQTLNATGFRKILKKHDKNFQTNLGDLWW